MNIRTYLAISLSVLILGGCTMHQSGKSISDEQASVIQEGISTKQDVLKKFGNPSSRYKNSQGNESWGYSFIKSEVDALSFIPIVGAFVGTATGESRVVSFSFNKTGVVTSIESVDAKAINHGLGSTN